jgi:hypothetical protein
MNVRDRDQSVNQNIHQPTAQAWYPMPPKSFKRSGLCTIHPMSLSDAEYWVASYDKWVDLWNKHERSRDLPLSPDWPEADTTAAAMFGRGVLMFSPRTCVWPGEKAVIKADFSIYHKGWSFCRNHLPIERIKWAGWLVEEPLRLATEEQAPSLGRCTGGAQ